MEDQGRTLRYYWSLLARRRWLMLVPFCAAMAAGLLLALKLPKTYEATTLILVQPQRVPEKMVQPVVTAGIEYRISTISQQILSRSNLERVIENFNLFSGEREMLPEDKIEDLRKRITVEVSRPAAAPRREADAFTIAYRDRDPTRTMRVTNGLAAFFIDENLRERESQAVGTSDFLTAELESMRVQLNQQEQLLKAFREQNMGALPDQLDANLKILDGLRQTLAQKEESLRSARVSVAALSHEIATRRSNAAAMAGGTVPPAMISREAEDFMTLDQLREKLAALRGSYTEQHPDVQRLKTKIATLEADRRPGAAPRASDGGIGMADSIRQKALLEGQVHGLEGDIVRVNQEIASYAKRVEATPKLEQELLILRRDYDNLKQSYNSLLNRKLEADIAVNMEKKQKGEQFQVIDVARLPERPVSPDLRKLFLAVLVVGLALGGGLVYLSDTLDTSVRRLEGFEDRYGLAILAAVPRVFTRRDRVLHRWKQAATAASLVVAFSLVAVFAVMAFSSLEPAGETMSIQARA